jgi:predicted dehydrogenase
MEAARQNNIHTYKNLEDILADASVDIVLCATPNDVHKDIVIDSLRAGKHVVCEKPVALSTAEFDEMCAAARRVAEKKYSEDANYEQLMKIYESVKYA